MVSRATVSRVLNGVTTVDPEMAEKVQRVIHEIGYIPNYQAQALARGRNKTVALIVSELSGGNPFFTELMLYFERAAVEVGYEVLIAFADIEAHPNDIATCVMRMLQRRVAGIAILTFGMEEQVLQLLPRRHVPLVFPDAPKGFLNVSSVKINYANGMRQAIQHLKELGHKRIAYLSGNLKLSGMANRMRAFREATKAAGLPWDTSLVIDAPHTFEGGVIGGMKLLEMPKRPTAIVCCNDVAAIGVLKSLRSSKLRVPQDMSIIGLDDLHMSRYSEPALTSIRFSPSELARLVFQALLQDIEPRTTSSAPSKFEYQTQLVIRESVGAPRAARIKLP
jgi:DNA-binding LacI/PurR family transcriptional regulator